VNLFIFTAAPWDGSEEEEESPREDEGKFQKVNNNGVLMLMLL
jgi:hypothetical protein